MRLIVYINRYIIFTSYTFFSAQTCISLFIIPFNLNYI
nr:MAG TPA: hypothetical protein [Caudoviricetes sp.]